MSIFFVNYRGVGGKSTNALKFTSNKHPQEQNVRVPLYMKGIYV